MATLVKSPHIETSHIYHAEAHALSGRLELPFHYEIRPQAFVNLEKKEGGYVSQRAEKYRLEGVISFESAYTQVSGNRSHKPGHGWVTLATSVVEGLNILDVITVDRVVSQLSTEHPTVDGHVPRVTFLGSRFENLRVSGYDVTPQLNLNVCGEKPEGDELYTQDPGFLDRLEQQCENMMKTSGLPQSLQQKYDRELQEIAGLRKRGNGSGKPQEGHRPKLECTLVTSVPQTPVSTAFGNVLEVPGFGLVSLAEVEVGTHYYPDDSRPSNYFRLTMLSMHMGCIGEGPLQAATAATNGKTKP
jgi:hypothetical protein